jgi:FKBP-type peptidyl-prolyl cis-trans isomerase
MLHRHPPLRRKSIALVLLAAASTGLAGCKQKQAEPKADAAANAPAEPVPQAPASPAPAAAPAAAHGFATPDDYTRPAVTTLELPNGLVIEDLQIGTGATVLPAATVTFHYRSKVKDGAEFDATAERPTGPAVQTYSLKSMMPGLRDGIVGMKVGGRRRLTIPSGMAFGWLGQKDAEGKVVVPPDATVVFVVDVLDTKLVLAPASPAAAPPPTQR